MFLCVSFVSVRCLYNVLNRHNPFSVVYDDRSREWRQISLIPVMPSFSYRITF